MKTALGVLKWTPSEFWNATPHDFLAAVMGANEASDTSGMTEERVAELQRMLKEDANGDTA